ncbi:MAG: hypothetical protein A2463_00565 [Candidatus Staskawiczbacteria bacterium RIFOXYC2_FULL_32_10]|nr:MAG: hypothetical protein A2463_00565 [Candidatus Staskawiczbacteria bacterium RIFOXYC2_FULL_32_10]
MKNKEKVEIFGKNKLLDFTYIDDCVDGIIKSIEKFDKVKNNTFNIASGKGQKLIDVAKIIKKELKSKSKILLRANRTGEVVKYVANISKAKKMLEYKPIFEIKKGLSLSIKWYKN